MDLDDLFEALLPKKKLKKLKKTAKKKGKALAKQGLSRATAAKPTRTAATAVKEERPSIRPKRQAEPWTLPDARRLQHSLQEAQRYQREVRRMADSAESGTIHQGRLTTTAIHVDNWVDVSSQIVGHIEAYRRDQGLQADWQATASAVAQMRRAVEKEKEPATRAKLEKALALREQQQQTLRHLEEGMNRAAAQLDITLAQMANLYPTLVSTRLDQREDIYRRAVADLEQMTFSLDDYLNWLESGSSPHGQNTAQDANAPGPMDNPWT